MAPRLLRWPLATMLSLSLMLGTFGSLSSVFASSHREAPLTSQDPAIDNTDTYAFMDGDSVAFVANSYPFGTAGGGPNFFRFADDAVYTIAISNDGDANAETTFVFKFKTTITNKNTFLYNTNVFPGGANVTQTYDLYKIAGDFNGRLPAVTTAIARDVPVAPAVVGSKSQPNYDSLVTAAIKDVNSDIKVFAGPRADAFYVDLNVFDLLALGTATNSIKDYNVQSIVMKVKKSTLLAGSEPVLGVCAMNYRLSVRVIRGENSRVDRGRYQQVSRLCNPLVNEVVMDLGLKDVFNGANPRNDATKQVVVDKVTSPELAGLMKAVLGPALGATVLGPDLLNFIPLTGRTDLVTIFLTGIPGMNQPANVVAAEMLRINTSTATAFPNGRKLTDDVVDIAVQAVAGAFYNLLNPTGPGQLTPANLTTISELADGVASPDKLVSTTFPYLASPYTKTTLLNSR